MIQSVQQFIRYFESVRRRTLRYAACVPDGQLEWSPQDGEFTCGDILRHMRASEVMFTEVATSARWRYPGHERDGQTSLEALLQDWEVVHRQAVGSLEQLRDEDLTELRPSLDGPELKTWRWLMAMVEHEIHHRSQLAVYLSLMGVKPPHIFGLGVEDLIARAIE